MLIGINGGYFPAICRVCLYFSDLFFPEILITFYDPIFFLAISITACISNVDHILIGCFFCFLQVIFMVLFFVTYKRKRYRLATGAFDKSLKIWTLDGDPTFRIDDFQGGGLSSFCYITRTKTLWVACGFNTPLIYDPKSGDNVRNTLI